MGKNRKKEIEKLCMSAVRNVPDMNEVERDVMNAVTDAYIVGQKNPEEERVYLDKFIYLESVGCAMRISDGNVFAVMKNGSVDKSDLGAYLGECCCEWWQKMSAIDLLQTVTFAVKKGLTLNFDICR